MKNFIISFIVTTAVIIYLNLPAVTASPIDSIGRIIMYLAFPVSIFVAMLGMAVVEFFGWVGTRTKPSEKVSYEPA